MPRIPRVHLHRTFEEVGGYDEIVLLKDIPFQSHCEHHLAPIIGKAAIAYLPNDRVVGISKLARVLHGFARRLQVQERLTAQVADTIWEHLKPKGVAVVIEASHACMTARGVSTPGVMMTTSRMMGIFRERRAQPARGAGADGLLMRAFIAVAVLLLAGCGSVEDGEAEGAATSNQIERLSTPEEEKQDPEATVRLQPINLADLDREGMVGAGCDFSREGQMLLASVGSDAVVKLGGEIRHMIHSTLRSDPPAASSRIAISASASAGPPRTAPPPTRRMPGRPASPSPIAAPRSSASCRASGPAAPDRIGQADSMASEATALAQTTPLRRVVMASMIGTTIEWYDFFLYGSAAALVFNRLFFPTYDPLTGTLLRLRHLRARLRRAAGRRHRLRPFRRPDRSQAAADAEPDPDGRGDGADRPAADL